MFCSVYFTVVCFIFCLFQEKLLYAKGQLQQFMWCIYALYIWWISCVFDAIFVRILSYLSGNWEYNINNHCYYICLPLFYLALMSCVNFYCSNNIKYLTYINHVGLVIFFFYPKYFFVLSVKKFHVSLCTECLSNHPVLGFYFDTLAGPFRLCMHDDDFLFLHWA